MKDGRPVANPWLMPILLQVKKFIDGTTDENGTFILTLPDGEYQIRGVWVDSESKWYPLIVSFTVQDGKVYNPEVLNLDLTEKGPNANGSVMKDGQPVSGVWVSARIGYR